MRRGMAVCAAALALVVATSAPAQDAGLELSAIIDLVLADSLVPGDAATDINTVNLGGGPYSPMRARLFLDGFLDDIVVSANVLFDSASTTRLDGAFLTWLDLLPDGLLGAQFGNLPTPFGSYAARTYSDRNPVIGTPMIYQYHTAAQGAALPASAADQLTNRSLSGGYQMRGLPVLYDSCWANGLVLFGELPAGAAAIEYAFGGTTSAVSNPKSSSNGLPFVVGRVGVASGEQLRLGVSAGYGPYLMGGAANLGGQPIGSFNQLVFGTDIALALGPVQLFVEAVRNTWDVANVTEGVLGVWAGYAELRYDVLTNIFLAARYEQMIFDSIDVAGTPTKWDFDIARIESGLGFVLAPGALWKLVSQVNLRPAAGDSADYLFASQISLAL